MTEIEVLKQSISVLSPDQVHIAKEKNPFAKISDIIYNALAEVILSSKITPGSKLNIAHIAQSFGVSRTPVLKAVEQLRDRGLIIERYESNKYRNYYVFDISNDSLSDLFDARKSIESSASEICASRVGLINMDKINKLANDFNSAWEGYVLDIDSAPSALERAEIDMEFHYLLVSSTGNKYLIDIFNSLQETLRYSSIRACEFVAGEKDKSNLLIMGSQHLSICRAIESGFPDLARKAMVVHLEFCHQRCLMGR